MCVCYWMPELGKLGCRYSKVFSETELPAFLGNLLVANRALLLETLMNC